MIERSGSTFEITCDFCAGEYLETDESDFHDAVRHVQGKGWKVFKRKGEWHHKCPGCARPEGMEEFNE